MSSWSGIWCPTERSVIDRRAPWSLALLAAAIAAAAFALTRWASAPPPSTRPLPARAAAPPASPPSAHGPLRWILAGGGPTPELNQVQLEQDVLLAAEVLARSGPGLTLFAGGPGSRAVQVLDPSAATDDLRGRLAALFDPRAGRDAHYREAAVHPGGAASAEAILAALEGALLDADTPLTLYLAGHGQGGDAPHESRFLTWGSHDLWVEDVAALLDELPGHRPLRMVITACYSGGFAELAFDGASEDRGPATSERCGFFATTWDRAASGCDPNPDRGAQEGYGIHFLHALRGEARSGDALPPEALDLDGDGAISLLEAHTRARIASGSLDVPVTTSERFLRSASAHLPDAPPGDDPPLPEERAVIEQLTRRMGLSRPERAHERLAWMTAELERLAAELDRLDEEIADAEASLAAALLHRWPVVDDPWHPRFAEVIDAEQGAIEAFLAESGDAGRRAGLTEERADVAAQHDRLLVESAPLERLVRAMETVDLAARLRAAGGEGWRRYQELLACERGAP